jgi:CheY-like chemotaxis protein
MNISILIVENESIISEDLRIRLENAGYLVSDIASSAEEAIQKIKQTWPDVVLWDPTFKNELNALELARKLSCDFRIPMIYVSGYEVPSGLQNYRKITKPIADEELFEVLCKILDGNSNGNGNSDGNEVAKEDLN